MAKVRRMILYVEGKAQKNAYLAMARGIIK